ncbi:MAG: type II secretion system inner membrane protein GspF [Candidatus Hydrogenedentes bacterium]|nr:type II secretion system inner membrane protein GspF [Candidatus Hydrogenedentota bacterium]
MAIYDYKAITKAGKTTKGVIDADSPAVARRKLREQDLFPTDMSEVAGAKKATASAAVDRPALDEQKGYRFILGGVPTRDLALMTRQFGVLLKAGMPLVDSLTALLEMTPRPRLKKAIYDVRDKVKSGSTLADALARHPRIFSQLYSNMVRAGEAGGALEQVLQRLAEIEEHQAKLKSQIKSALAYPAFMAVVAVGIVTFLMLVIVPRITMIFEKQEQELPAITKVMVSTSSFIGHFWWLIFGVVVSFLVLWRIWVGTERGRLKWDRVRLRLPVYGSLLVKLISARFARTLGTMLESGLTMMNSLDVVKSVIGNKSIEGCMDDVKAGVRRGKDLAQPLRETGFFPPMLVHMIELGQRSGQIEDMLLRVADTYDEDVRLATESMVGLLEPIIIIFMGVVVGFLVLAILLPILSMSQNIA